MSPCAAVEIGQLYAAGPLSDAALWGAVGVHARGRWTVAPPFLWKQTLAPTFH